MCTRIHIYSVAQIVAGRGHGLAADWWALGILLFEMLVGYSPFCDGEGGRQAVIYKHILKGRYRIPSSVTHAPARDLISRLLVADPALRLTGEQVWRHEFFDGLDWEGLTNGKLVPPIRPQVSSATDLRCFSSTCTTRREAKDFATKVYNGVCEFEGF